MNDDSQPVQPLKWAPHELIIYDETLKTGSTTELQRLAAATPQERLGFIIDPREVHKRLYAALTPEDHPEYAGTYRGTSGTSLERRCIGVHREDDNKYQEFIAPDRVLHCLEAVANQAKKIFNLPPATSSSTVLVEIVRLFYIFGLTHPFLDGNGHIQRLIFSVCILERESLQLSEKWTIHPRPYDIEIKSAFEAPTTKERLTSLCQVLSAYVLHRPVESKAD